MKKVKDVVKVFTKYTGFNAIIIMSILFILCIILGHAPWSENVYLSEEDTTCKVFEISIADDKTIVTDVETGVDYYLIRKENGE